MNRDELAIDIFLYYSPTSDHLFVATNNRAAVSSRFGCAAVPVSAGSVSLGQFSSSIRVHRVSFSLALCEPGSYNFRTQIFSASSERLSGPISASAASLIQRHVSNHLCRASRARVLVSALKLGVRTYTSRFLHGTFRTVRPLLTSA